MSDPAIVKRKRLVGYDNAVNFLPYYTSDVWSADESYFIFFSDPTGADTGVLSLNTYSPSQDRYQTILDLSTLAPSRALWQDPYARMITATHVRQTQTVLLPVHNRICHISIPDRAMRYSKAVFPDNTLLSGPFHASHDGKYLVANYFPASEARPQKTTLFIYDIAREEVIFQQEMPFFANHPQFFANSDRILFCHEGPTEQIPQRVHLLEWKLALPRHYPIYPQAHSARGEQIECVGHEMPAGDQVIAVRYPVSRMEGCGIILVDPQTKTSQLLDHDDYLHVASNLAGDIFVMDTCWWGNTRRKTPDQSDVFLFDNRTRTKHFLATVCCAMKSQAYHVHPRLNARGDVVLCSAKESVTSPNARILCLEL